MTASNAHPLTNLPLWGRVARTLALGLGACMFTSVWWVIIAISGWGVSLRVVLTLGERLGSLDPVAWSVLLGVHAASLLLLLGVLWTLMKQLALPKGFRFWLNMACVGLAAGDLLLWAVVRVLPSAQILFAPTVLSLALLLLVLSLLPLREMWLFSRWKHEGPTRRVLIVGGGFGGMYTALELDRRLGYHPGLEVVLLDRRNYFLFPPLLPSVATGAIETRQVTSPFRRVFEATNVQFRREEIVDVDFEARTVRSEVVMASDTDQPDRKIQRTMAYDLLVLSPGSTIQTYGTPGVRRHAFFMRELSDAVGLRNHIIDCFENAATETNPSLQRQLMRFVIVGGGPTGVELAAELHDLVMGVLADRYPEVNHNFIEVYLVQSAAGLVPGWDARLAAATEAQIAAMQIKVLLGVKVRGVTAHAVELDTGEHIATRTVCWCAGTRPSPLLKRCALRLERGRALVEPDLQAVGMDGVYVLGDAAAVTDPRTGRPLPPLAQVAVQQGTYLGQSLVRRLKGEPMRPFKYFDYGALMAVGERFAVASLMGMQLTGPIAWFIWRTLYIAKMVGLGNRVRVVLDWTLDLLLERSIAQIGAGRQPERMEVQLSDRAHASQQRADALADGDMWPTAGADSPPTGEC